jgi:hypothetical protein
MHDIARKRNPSVFLDESQSILHSILAELETPFRHLHELAYHCAAEVLLMSSSISIC